MFWNVVLILVLWHWVLLLSVRCILFLRLDSESVDVLPIEVFNILVRIYFQQEVYDSPMLNLGVVFS
jgi:hypothetical protein